MKYSGLYFVSNPSTNIDTSISTVNSLIQGIEASFQNASRQTPWSLSYRSFRDAIPPGHQPSKDATGKAIPYDHSHQHLVHLSNLASNRTYIYIEPAAQPGTIASIPLRQQDAHISVLKNQYSALWTPRYILAVREGATYTGGMCTIEIGELRSIREGGPQSGAATSPGIVLCISTTVGADDSADGTDPSNNNNPSEKDTVMDMDGEDADFDYAQALIRDCWAKMRQGRDLGRSEVKEFFMAPTLTAHREQEREAAVRMWCEALRLRG